MTTVTGAASRSRRTFSCGTTSSPHRAEHAAALALADDAEAAKAQAAEALRLNPKFSATGYAASLPFARTEDRERLKKGLSKSGFVD